MDLTYIMTGPELVAAGLGCGFAGAAVMLVAIIVAGAMRTAHADAQKRERMAAFDEQMRGFEAHGRRRREMRVVLGGGA